MKVSEQSALCSKCCASAAVPQGDQLNRRIRAQKIFPLVLALLLLLGAGSAAGLPVARAQVAPDPQRLILPGYGLDASATGDVYGDNTQATAVLSHAFHSQGTPVDGRADLFACDAMGGDCALALTVPLPGYEGGGGLFIAPLTGEARQQLVVYTIEGSGGFLSYQVFGVLNGQLLQLLERDGIFHGRVEARANGLLESTTDRSMLYTWNGNEFVGAQVSVSQPLPIGAVRVHYTVSSGNVIGPNQVSLKVGQSLELVRDDSGSDNTRILLGSDLLTIDKWPVLKTTKPGQTSITIIPRGYDWQNQLEVTVVVVP